MRYSARNAGGEVMVEGMVKMFIIVWREEVVPGDWKKAIFLPIFKKGSRLDCWYKLQGN